MCTRGGKGWLLWIKSIDYYEKEKFRESREVGGSAQERQSGGGERNPGLAEASVDFSLFLVTLASILEQTHSDDRSFARFGSELCYD